MWICPKCGKELKRKDQYHFCVKPEMIDVLESINELTEEAPLLAEPPHFIRVLEACVEAVPAGMVIHRLTGDGAKRELIAPLWSADKKRVLNAINRAFARDQVTQGKHWKG